MFSKLVLVLIVIAALVGGSVWWIKDHSASSINKPTSSAGVSKSSTSQITPSPRFNKAQYSLSDPTSIWVVVNKQRPLNPLNFVPPDLVVPSVPLRVPGNESMQLRSVSASALQTLFAAAAKQGINLMLSSGYRSYSYQLSLYNSYVNSIGQAAADASSARPGHSEHQTGLAADIEPLSQKCDVSQCFGQLPEGQWLVANAYKYGFIIRYTTSNQAYTGYEAEPWHIRYVGVALSTEMHNTNSPSLEQFFGLPAATSY